MFNKFGLMCRHEFTAEVTHPTNNEKYGGVHTFEVSQSNHNKKYSASTHNMGCTADIYDTPEQAIDYLIQAQACTRVSEIKEVKEEMENKLDAVKETSAYKDLKENAISLNNLKDRIYDLYTSDYIDAIFTDVNDFGKYDYNDSICAIDLAIIENIKNCISDIKIKHDQLEIETQEDWVFNKIGSLIKMMDYDIKDIQRQLDKTNN